jgi:flagellar basal body-associated protein FliL
MSYGGSGIMMKNILRKDSKGVATAVIVIVAILVIAVAGVATYVVLSDNNSNEDSKDTPNTPSPLGGPGLSVGETLTYAFSASTKISADGEKIELTDAIKGTFTIKCAQGSNDDYILTISVDASYDILGMKDHIVTSESITVSSLDMSGFDTNTADLSDLADYGYTAEDIKKIQALIDKYKKSTVTLDTVDGSIDVEKRAYSYTWNDLKSLIPEMDELEDIPIKKLNIDYSMWFGKDVLYKAEIDLNIEMEMEGEKMTAEVSLDLDLTKHQKV